MAMVSGCATGGGSGGTSPSASGAASGDRVTVVQNQLDAGLAEKLNAAAADAYRGVSAPGVVMAIRTPKGTWVTTIGYQDQKKTIPMTADVHQRIGSVTKTFTVTALMKLAEQGKLSLEDPIEKYVPGMPNGNATLYQLATMRSGIPSYTFDESFQEKYFTDPHHTWTPQQLVDLVKKVPAMYPPGTRTFYSNTNTILLGMVVEKASGMPIETYLKQQVIDPLHLSATVFPTGSEFANPHARGYTVQGTDDGKPVDATDWNPSWGWSAGAMVSDLDDLLSWGKALATGEGVLSPQSQARRIGSFDFSVPVYGPGGAELPQTPARAYGLGMSLALGWYGHTGELPGYNTVVQYHVQSGTTLIVMVNSDIKSGDCPAGSPTTPGGRTTGACEDPAVYVAEALAAALGQPLVA